MHFSVFKPLAIFNTFSVLGSIFYFGGIFCSYVNMSSVLAGIFHSSMKSHLLTRFLFLQAYSIQSKTVTEDGLKKDHQKISAGELNE
jgi:polyferredoxin